MHSVKLELIKDVSLPDNILVGKDVLELVSGAMYVDPLDIFREYVQNATDSIDQSDQNDKAQIDIILDPNSRSITVRDNGAGLSNNVLCLHNDCNWWQPKASPFLAAVVLEGLAA